MRAWLNFTPISTPCYNPFRISAAFSELCTLDPNLPMEAKNSIFTSEQRVDLFRLATDLFPPPRPHWMGGEEGGGELHALKDLLERNLHRLPSQLSLAGIEAWFQKFILSEPDEVLLTLIELMPVAQFVADEKERRNDPRGSYFLDLDTDRKIKKITECVNKFLGRTVSPARFGQDGHFNRNAFAIEVPSPLRHLPSREMLLADITRLLKDAWPVSAIFVDLDGFKSVNDQFGHSAGDRCLETVADIIGNVITHKGRLYKYGGDEFVAVLINFQTEEAKSTAERIRLSIENANPGGRAKITASIGVVCSDQLCDRDAKAFVEAADKAVYSSKNGGKNRVTVWEPT